MSDQALAAIRDATRNTVFEEKLYLVGGAVRDSLLGLPASGDLDLVTTESSEELAHWLRPISSIPPVTYPRFGTAMIKIEGVDIELVTARKESYEEMSRKPNVEPATLQEDAFRRDFTVNAILRNLHTGELVDPTGQGLSDLEARILRTTSDPEARFVDDPLRLLRTVRFRWKLGFEPVEGLYEAVMASRERLRIISMERIRDEFSKMVLHPSAPDAMRDLMKLGLLEMFAPEFLAMVDCEQGKYHHLDVWEHTLLVLKNVGTTDLVLRLSALFHDVGKPPTRTIDENGQTRFFGHEGVGKEMTRTILKRLRFPSKEAEEVVLLVGNHMRLGSSPSFSSSAARRLLRDLEGQEERLLALVEADMNGLKTGVVTMDLGKIRDRLEAVKIVTPVSQLESPLSGTAIMEILGLPAGPHIGRVKTMLTEKVLDGELEVGDKEGAKRLLMSTENLMQMPEQS